MRYKAACSAIGWWIAWVNPWEAVPEEDLPSSKEAQGSR
jgi:hypothetical protein